MKALDALDPAFEHRARLAIAVLLARHGEISFARFKQELALTDGNLGAQLRRRDFVERKPVTWYALNREGRKALDRHLAALRAVIGG